MLRIAFDLDDTLIPATRSFACGTEPHSWVSLFFREPLRLGTVNLMRQLIREGHAVWIYTSSMRSARYLSVWFGLLGIRLSGVVNAATHQQATEREVRRHSKSPRLFDIDLLIDDSEGVEQECAAQGVSSVRLLSDDLSWTLTVENAVRHLTRNSPSQITDD